MTRQTITAGVLDVACDEHGPADGWPVVLMHGFPYDVHAYDEVVPLLTAQGARVIVPFMRGYGPTRYRTADTVRSGQQGAFGADLLALLDALRIPQAVLGGYDWGGRAACVVAALRPERVAGLVSVNGYNIQDIASAMTPAAAAQEQRLWYQYYFHSERGQRGLAADRRALCRLLWQLWSPTWRFDEATFERSAEAFDNPDFVATVIHSYRHRFSLVAGDPAYDDIERQLAARPVIPVPTIYLDGRDDGVSSSQGQPRQADRFARLVDYRCVDGVGHNLPQEAPAAFAQAVLDVRALTTRP